MDGLTSYELERPSGNLIAARMPWGVYLADDCHEMGTYVALNADRSGEVVASLTYSSVDGDIEVRRMDPILMMDDGDPADHVANWATRELSDLGLVDSDEDYGNVVAFLAALLDPDMDTPLPDNAVEL